MQDLILQAKKRSPKSKVDGIKGVVYGKEQPAESIEVDQLTVERLHQVAGGNRVVDLVIDGGKAIKVLFQDVQYDPATNNIQHFDLHAVSLKEKITAEVPVNLVGDSPAVIAREGTLTTVTDTVEVEAEPLSLPEKFDIDISQLAEVNDSITIGDLKTPAGVEILSEPELLIVKIEALSEEPEEEPEPAEGEEGEDGAASEEETTEGDSGEDKAEEQS